MRLTPFILAGLVAALAAQDARAFQISEKIGGWIGFGFDNDAAEDGAKAITWEDLTPPLSAEQKAAASELNMRIDTMTDDEITRALDLIELNGGEIIEELDGETVSIEGYLVPLDFEATEVKAFVLVPFIGACIHVPPPPPNQVIFVEYKKGVPMEALEENFWAPFRVTGVLRAAPAKTDLADVGYQMTAARVTTQKL